MASLIDNVNKVIVANTAIKTAIANQGIDVTDYTKLTQAADKIALIKSIHAESPNSLYAEYEFIEIDD